MIIVTASLEVKKDKKGALVPIILDLIFRTKQEKGCISYELLQSTENEYCQTFLERWESMDDLNAHMKTEHFIKFSERTKDFFVKDLEISVYDASKIN